MSLADGAGCSARSSHLTRPRTAPTAVPTTSAAEPASLVMLPLVMTSLAVGK